MNNKEIVAQAIHQVVKEDLSIEQVQQLLEKSIKRLLKKLKWSVRI